MLGIAIVLVMLLSASLAAAAAVPPQENTSVTGSSGYSTYIVAFNDQGAAASAGDQVTSFINSYNGRIIHKYSVFSGMAVTLPDDRVDELRAMANVRYVEKDQTVHVLLDKAVPQIGADKVRSAGYAGKGVKVCVIDTGIDAGHPDLGGGKVVGWVDYVSGKSSPYDDHGHGTHVSSTIAGTGAASDGKYKGVAPDASLMGVKVLGRDGSGSNSNIIKGIDWAVQNGADVISMSLGSSTHSQATDDAINNAIRAGVVCVIAAGNSGPSANSIACPGDNPNAITVGASDRNDQIASFSSRGPNRDGSVKPDVTNMGVGLVAARATGTSQGKPVNDYYTALSGTSMATPMTSGVVALLLSAKADLTPQQVKDVLTKTAVPLGGSVPNNNFGYGRVDAKAAVDYALSGKLPEPRPTPTPGPSPSPSPTPTPQPGDYAVSLVNMFARYNNRIGQIESFTVVPGTTIIQSMMVSNTGGATDSYRVAVSGIPPAWYRITGYTGGYIDPDSAASLNLYITPPAGIKAGAYRFTVTATSNADPGVSDARTYTLNVGTAASPSPTPTATPRPTATPTPTPPPGPTPTPVPGTAFTGSLANDEDYYTYIVPAQTGLITAKIDWQGTSNDLDMYLFDPEGKQVAKSEKRYTTSESLQYGAPKAGYYLLKVHAQRAYQTVSFNGEASQAVQKAYVKIGSLKHGESFTANVYADGKRNVNARLSWSWGINTLTLSLYDAAGRKLAEIAGSQGDMMSPYEQLDYAPASAGTYTLRVNGAKVSGSVSYRLISPYQL